jgi:quercetin dioxygenase-like cupin family protein
MQPERIENKSLNDGSQEALMMMQGRIAELDIEKELDELQRSPAWHNGIARKVLIRYPDFQITLRAMKANARIPEHHNPGRICVQTVRGHIRMHADGRFFDLPQGKALILDRAVTHDVEALEESAFLLTVAFPESSAR